MKSCSKFRILKIQVYHPDHRSKSIFSKEIRHDDYVNAITEAACVRPVLFRKRVA